MQFHHPHGFRQQVVEALLAEMPEVWDDLITAGAQPATLPGQPERVIGLRCRRPLFERVLRSAAEAQPGVTLRTGYVDGICYEHGCAVGVRVDGHQVDANLVVDASGRAGQPTRAFRGPVEGGDCGIAYVSRQYQLLPGAQHGPMNAPFGMMTLYPGYQAVVFIQDNRTFSTLIVRGIVTSLMQAQRLVHLLDEHRRDFISCSLEFDRWCAENIKPWFSDHVYWDAELIRRWSGHDVDLTRPLPSDLIMAATEADPEMLKVVGPFMAMVALPASLAAVEPRAREIYASGWRPPLPDGPTRDELAELITAVVRAT
jgi:hypothetical protein